MLKAGSILQAHCEVRLRFRVGTISLVSLELAC